MNATLERKVISRHDVIVYRALESARDWLTNRDISERVTPSVAHRTVRAATKRFVEEGIAEVREVFPGYRYRLLPAHERDSEFYGAILKAQSAFEASE